MKPRFGLRTFFVLIAIAAIPMAWVAYQLNWIRLRHAYLNQRVLGPSEASLQSVSTESTWWRPAPWTLRWFGERGMSVIIVLDPEKIEYVQNLFPEAELRLIVWPNEANRWDGNFVSIPKQPGTKSQTMASKNSQD